MKKKELLALRSLEATDHMMELVEQDEGQPYTQVYGYYERHRVTYDLYERYQYYRAIVQKGILKVAIFSRKLMARGIRRPEYELYISKKEKKWLTYDVAEKTWKTACIDKLPYDLDRGFTHGNYPWASPETKNIVNGYLGTEGMEVREAVLHFQKEARKDIEIRRSRKITDWIDGIMATVPKLPKDFDRWVIDSAFSRNKNLFYHNDTMTGYCTACEQEVQLKARLSHNAEIRCPHCRKPVTAKAWGKQKYTKYVKQTGILQELTDKSGYVLRVYKCVIRRTKDADWRMTGTGAWEEYRFILDKDFQRHHTFEWGTTVRTGIDRWNRPEDIKNPGYNYWYRYVSEDCVLYHRNIKKLRQGTFLQYIPWEKRLQSYQGHSISPIEEIAKMRKEPNIEYLIKGGLMHLTRDLLQGGLNSGINMSQNQIWKMLKVRKEQLSMCISMDISHEELMILRRANAHEQKLEVEQIRFLAKELGSARINILFAYGHIEKKCRYLHELKAGGLEYLSDYLDYLEDLEYMKIEVRKADLFPQHFEQAHRDLADRRREEEKRRKNMEQSEKDRLFREKIFPAVQELYEMADESFAVVIPTCKADFQEEGRMNHNCVGGSYFDRMLNGETVVFFLRQKSNMEKAYCTVEMKGDKIIQCRSSCNQAAPPEAMDFMEKLVKEVRRRQEKMKREQIKVTA